MLKITSSELQRRIGAQLDAAQREPIVIVSNGRERAVLVSVEEYRRLKQRDREFGLADEDLAAAQADAAIDHLRKAGKYIDLSTDELLELTRGD